MSILKSFLLLFALNPAPAEPSPAANVCEPGGCCFAYMRSLDSFYMVCVGGNECPDGHTFLSCEAGQCFDAGPNGSCTGVTTSTDTNPCCSGAAVS